MGQKNYTVPFDCKCLYPLRHVFRICANPATHNAQNFDTQVRTHSRTRLAGPGFANATVTEKRCQCQEVRGSKARFSLITATLQQYHVCFSFRNVLPGCSSPCFGTYLVCDRPGKIRVDDPVYILRKRTS